MPSILIVVRVIRGAEVGLGHHRIQSPASDQLACPLPEQARDDINQQSSTPSRAWASRIIGPSSKAA